MHIQHALLENMLVTTVEGPLDLHELKSVMESTARAAALDGHHVLIDLRGSESGGDLSYSDVYRVVRQLGHYPEAGTYCVALVDQYRKAFEKAQFFEASATERGYHVRAFLDYDAAVQWLNSKSRIC